MLIAIVGASASGKNTFQKHICKDYGLTPVVTCTTRPKRACETDGVEYKFISDGDYEQYKQSGLLALCSEYRSWKYGCFKSDLEKDDSAIIVTPKGYRELKKLYKSDVMGVYIKADRRTRLIRALQRGDDIDEACRRSQFDEGQFDLDDDEFDIVINNHGASIGEMLDTFRRWVRG